MQAKNKKYKVTLNAGEREDLSIIVSNGKAAAKKILHARILLKADEGLFGSCWTDEQISKALEVSQRTIERVRQRCVEESIEAALIRKPRPRSSHQKFDGKSPSDCDGLFCSSRRAATLDVAFAGG